MIIKPEINISFIDIMKEKQMKYNLIMAKIEANIAIERIKADMKNQSVINRMKKKEMDRLLMFLDAKYRECST